MHTTHNALLDCPQILNCYNCSDGVTPSQLLVLADWPMMHPVKYFRNLWLCPLGFGLDNPSHDLISESSSLSTWLTQHSLCPMTSAAMGETGWMSCRASCLETFGHHQLIQLTGLIISIKQLCLFANLCDQGFNVTISCLSDHSLMT